MAFAFKVFTDIYVYQTQNGPLGTKPSVKTIKATDN